MRAPTFVQVLFDTAFRFLPDRVPTGLFPIGNPDARAPVVLTGNYALTVRRVRRALRCRNVWLLITDSGGINVWCAASGGHLTHHDVISTLRTSGVDDAVDHRTVVLPQLAATGVERSKVTDATGWDVVWGPAAADDLPAFLDRGLHTAPSERAVRFPISDRLQMAAMWAIPMSLILGAILWPAAGARLAVTGVVMTLTMAAVLFLAMPFLWVTGPRRLLTYTALAALGFGAGFGLTTLSRAVTSGETIWIAVVSIVIAAVLSTDLTGSTPILRSTINPHDYDIELVADRCTGAAQCVLVCPRGVLSMVPHARQVEIVAQEDCILCGACIVQCPEDALRFRFADGSIVEPSTVRSTRLNLLGKRTVTVHDASGS